MSCLLSEGLEAGDEISRAVFESAIAEVNVPDKQWRLGDYEILDEIGRGGMGVIYLARQRHPNRTVAVKRVLNYHADSHETLKRFPNYEELWTQRPEKPLEETRKSAAEAASLSSG